jgi:ADP-ribose pyrophosphatase
MKLITTIKDTDLGFPEVAAKQVKKRRASRAVLIDENKRICLVWAKNGNFYKLPGGGIDEGETEEQAMYREIQEEVGYKCEIIAEIGKIRTLRLSSHGDSGWGKGGLDQISFCWLARAKEFIGSSPMEDEVGDGFEAKWFNDIDAAIAVVEEAEPKATKHTSLQSIAFFTARESEFLREAKKLLAKM